MKKIYIFILLTFVFVNVYAKPRNLNQIKENDINVLNQLGKISLDEKDYKLAELYFQKSLTIQNNYEANIQLANLKIQLRENKLAEDYLLSAYELNNSEEVIWYLSIFYARNNSFEKAKNYYDKIIEISEDLFKLYITYGELGSQYYYEYNFDLAEEYLGKAISIYSNNKDIIEIGYNSPFSRYVNKYSYLNSFSYYNKNYLENKENKQLYIKYKCNNSDDFKNIKEKQKLILRKYSERTRWGNLIKSLCKPEDAIPLEIGDIIKIPSAQPFVVVDRIKEYNKYTYLFTYTSCSLCYLVISDKQIDLENHISFGIKAKNDYYLKYLGKSTYQSNYQDIECLMFEYYEDNSIAPIRTDLYDNLELN